MSSFAKWLSVCMAMAVVLPVASARAAGKSDLDALKRTAVVQVDRQAKLVQEIVDSVFSFSEPAYQEFATQKYVGAILKKHGFRFETGVAGIPSGWVATWSHGSGRPVISLNNDEDDLRGLSQMPGVLKREPIVPGAPGHGEGHNTGVGGMVVAAIVLKDLMEKNNISGTIQVWPGIAEELVGGKAYYVRAGVFKDVDAVLSTHVGDALATSFGRDPTTGLVSVQYSFTGKAAHAGADPWDGRSALAGVELMDAGIQYQRQFYRPSARTHHVITDGGDQPNIVPAHATVWYYFRENSPDRIRENYESGNRIAAGAAMMTGTTMTHRLIGEAWPGWGNEPIAQAMQANIERVGMPAWSKADKAYALAVQKTLGLKPVGLKEKVDAIGKPIADPHGGYSDDIGDVMWTVPTVRLLYPSNIPGVPFHTWQAALAEATPIAHKGAVADAKVLVLTALDMYLKPELLAAAKAYFEDVQTRTVKYRSFLAPDDAPAIHINDAVMEQYRPLLEKHYYDPAKYDSYLQQLGVAYPARD